MFQAIRNLKNHERGNRSSARVRVIVYIVTTMLFVMSELSGVQAQSGTTSTSQIALGDYTFGSPGGFRRLVITHGKSGTYEIWRARPKGKLQYLRFTILSPNPTPTESSDYLLEQNGVACGHLGLHIYQDESGALHPAIILAKYGSHQNPMGSAGWALSKADFTYDQKAISKVVKDSANPHFYDSLSAAAQAELNGGIPECHQSSR